MCDMYVTNKFLYKCLYIEFTEDEISQPIQKLD